MTGRLEDKVAIVTGAASGIGKATVAKFLNEGAQVLATDVNEDGLSNLLDSMGEGESRLVAFFGSVASRSDVAGIFAECISRYGRLDLLVNSAGITPRALPPEADLERFGDDLLILTNTALYQRQPLPRSGHGSKCIQYH